MGIDAVYLGPRGASSKRARASGPEDAGSAMQGIQRAVTVLEFLAAQQAPCGPSYIARELGLPKPTVVRILQTWCSLGYVVGHSAEYELGWKALVLTNTRTQARDLQVAARRHMRHLNEMSGEAVHLAVPMANLMFYVDKIEGQGHIRVYGEIGKFAPLHATASGKAALAASGTDFVDRVLKEPLERYTKLTVCDSSILREELRVIARRGYSVNRGEWHEGVGGVGSPIIGRDGQLEATITVSYAVSAVDEDRQLKIAEFVSAAANALSHERGWAGGSR